MVKNQKVCLEISVNKTEKWGYSQPNDVAKLIENCTINFLSELKPSNFPSGKIRIDHSHNPIPGCPFIKARDYPSCEYTTNSINKNELEKLKDRIIYLNVDNRDWSKFSFQYLHEFCHYITLTFSNNWFIEALCELSSLYFLRKMWKKWNIKPPYDNWRDYREFLWNYAIKRLNSTNKLESSLGEWYVLNKDALSNNSTIRELNNVVAKYYLPYFENMPSIWNILCYLPVENIQIFDLFMQSWLDKCPDEYKKYICKFSKDLGLDLKNSKHTRVI